MKRKGESAQADHIRLVIKSAGRRSRSGVGVGWGESCGWGLQRRRAWLTSLTVGLRICQLFARPLSDGTVVNANGHARLSALRTKLFSVGPGRIHTPPPPPHCLPDLKINFLVPGQGVIRAQFRGWGEGTIVWPWTSSRKKQTCLVLPDAPQLDRSQAL